MGEHDVAVNRRARHDFFIEETYEAGIALVGSEVKSVRAGRVNLKDSYGRIENGELWLFNAHISPYAPAAAAGHDPVRPRKLLLHRRQIQHLLGKVKERGYTLVPLRVYFKEGRAKVEIGLARGKKLYDKRRAIREREMRRELQRTVRR